MKKILITSITIFLILVIILPSVLITTRSGNLTNDGVKQVSLTKTTPYIFKFTSDRENLTEISIDLKNPGIKNNSLIEFNISSSDSNRELVFYGNNVGDPSTVPLKFLQFSDKAGTKYTVNLTTDNQKHDELYIITNNQNEPIFKSYYKQSNIKENIVNSFKYKTNQVSMMSHIHIIIYTIVMVMLSYFLIKNEK